MNGDSFSAKVPDLTHLISVLPLPQGTSYTMTNTKVVTNRTTATNSGQEVGTHRVWLLSSASIASFGGSPFIRYPGMMLPDNKLVLTKVRRMFNRRRTEYCSAAFALLIQFTPDFLYVH